MVKGHRVIVFGFAPIHNADVAPSYIDRIQDWVSENRRAILVTTAVALIAAGAVYYASSTCPPSSKGKFKEKKSKKKLASDSDRPIIEEVKPRVEEVDGLSHRFPPLGSLTPPHRKCIAVTRANSCHVIRGLLTGFPPCDVYLTRLSPGTRKAGCVPQDTG